MSRVLSTDEAKEAIRQIQSIVNGGLVSDCLLLMYGMARWRPSSEGRCGLRLGALWRRQRPSWSSYGRTCRRSQLTFSLLAAASKRAFSGGEAVYRLATILRCLLVAMTSLLVTIT